VRDKLPLPPVVFDNSRITEMHDLLALELFLQASPHQIFNDCMPQTFLAFFSWFLLIVGLTSCNFSTKTLCDNFETAFWLLYFFRILLARYPHPPDTIERIRPNKYASLYTTDQLQHALSTFYALIVVLRNSSCPECLNHLSSNHLEHLFGKARLRCLNVNIMKRFLSDSICYQQKLITFLGSSKFRSGETLSELIVKHGRHLLTRYSQSNQLTFQLSSSWWRDFPLLISIRCPLRLTQHTFEVCWVSSSFVKWKGGHTFHELPIERRWHDACQPDKYLWASRVPHAETRCFDRNGKVQVHWVLEQFLSFLRSNTLSTWYLVWGFPLRTCVKSFRDWGKSWTVQPQRLAAEATSSNGWQLPGIALSRLSVRLPKKRDWSNEIGEWLRVK
jgi:hypothetical protein